MYIYISYVQTEWVSYVFCPNQDDYYQRYISDFITWIGAGMVLATTCLSCHSSTLGLLPDAPNLQIRIWPVIVLHTFKANIHKCSINRTHTRSGITPHNTQIELSCLDLPGANTIPTPYMGICHATRASQLQDCSTIICFAFWIITLCLHSAYASLCIRFKGLRIHPSLGFPWYELCFLNWIVLTNT